MHLKRIKVEGIGPHHDTEITLPDGLFAVTGDTGAGKSTLMGSAVACLYGFFPDGHRLQQGLTANGSGKGLVEIEFTHRGSVYTASRTVGSTTKANLHQDGELIAGPKVGDFDAAVESLLGSRELCDAIWYAARKPRVDLITGQPAQRRQIFGELVNFEELNRISAKFKGEAKDAEAKASSIRAGLPNVGHLQEELEQMVRTKEAEETHRDARRNTIERLESDLTRERNAADLIGTPADYTHKQRAAEQSNRLYSNRLAELSDLNSRLDGYTKAAAGLDAATAAVEEVKALEAERSDLEQQRELYEKSARWKSDRERLSDQVHKLAMVGVGHEPPVHIRDGAAKYDFLSGEVSVITKEVSDLSGKKAKVIAEADAAIRRLAELKEEARSKPVTPADDATCARCPLMVKWQGIGQQLEQAGEAVAYALASAERITKEHRDAEIRLRNKRDDFENAGRCCRDVERYETEQKSAAALIEQRDRLYAEIASMDADPPVHGCDPRPEISRIDARLSEQRRLANGYGVAEAAAEKLPEMTTKAAELRTEVDRLREESTAAHAAETEAKEAFKSVSDARAVHDEKIADLTRTIAGHRNCLETYVAGISRIEARIESIEADIEGASEKNAEAQRIDKRAQMLSFLSVCYSPKGVQPILLDKFLPRLDDLMNEILDEMTERRLRCAWGTRSVSAGGDIVEALDLTVIDQNGERDAGLCSGGEQQTLQIALRIALNIWVSELRGANHFETLIIDEAGNNTDDDATRRLFEQVSRVANRFGNVGLITPKTEAASLIPQRLYVSRRGLLVEVLK